MNRQLSKEQLLERLVDTLRLGLISLRNAADYFAESRRDAEALLDEHRDELRAEEETPRRVFRELAQRFDDEPVTLDESVLRGVTR